MQARIGSCSHEGALHAISRHVHLAAISVGNGSPVIQQGARRTCLLHHAGIRGGVPAAGMATISSAAALNLPEGVVMTFDSQVAAWMSLTRFLLPAP